MKGLIVLLLLPLGVLAQRSQKMQLTGTLQLPYPVAQVYLSYRTPNAAIYDSVKPKSGTFVYKTLLAEPTPVTLQVRYVDGMMSQKSRPVILFLQPGKMVLTVKDSLEHYTVTGSPAHDDYQQLAAQLKPYENALNKLYDKWDGYSGGNNKEAQQAVEAQIDSVNVAMREAVYRPFVLQHPQSLVALYAVKQYAGYDMDGDKVEPLFSALPEETKHWPSAIVFNEAIAIAKKTGIGKVAMDFTQADTAGKPVSLSQFRGRYVLVDFWASWCSPCRAENPNVVQAFNQYKHKGFTVLGVSLDRPNGREKWLKAIHNDSLAWTHVSDLKFWNNAVAKQYGVRAIPQNFLIDPQGTIIGRNLRGEALIQKLSQLFGTKSTF
jgi:peroxiredoxin